MSCDCRRKIKGLVADMRAICGGCLCCACAQCMVNIALQQASAELLALAHLSSCCLRPVLCDRCCTWSVPPHICLVGSPDYKQREGDDRRFCDGCQSRVSGSLLTNGTRCAICDMLCCARCVGQRVGELAIMDTRDYRDCPHWACVECVGLGAGRYEKVPGMCRNCARPYISLKPANDPRV